MMAQSTGICWKDIWWSIEQQELPKVGRWPGNKNGRQLRAQPDFHLGRDWLECRGWELSACLNLLNAAPSHIKNSSNISFITAREWREGNRYFILLSRVGDITLPPNYFDISVKWCSLYAHTVLSVLHISIYSFLQHYVVDVLLPICTTKKRGSRGLFAPNHTVNGRLWSEALRLQNVCFLYITQSRQRWVSVQRFSVKNRKKKKGENDMSTNNKSTIKCLFDDKICNICFLYILCL